MASEKTWTVLALLEWTRQFFKNKNIESPRLEAELLLAHVLGWERIHLYTKFDYVLPADKLAAFKEMIVQRADHTPTQYILGTCEFYSLEFRVTPAVLIPRPETEHLVEALISRAKGQTAARVLELGTGSGCIVVAAAKALPLAEFVAVDLSADALAIAAENAAKHGVDSRIRFIHGDFFEPLAGQSFDYVVSNPPYIGEDEWRGLAPEVRDHEPRTALVGGQDGLDAYRRIIPAAPAHLQPGGRLLLELPAAKARLVRQIAEKTPLVEEETIPDYAKIERVLVLAMPQKDSAAE